MPANCCRVRWFSGPRTAAAARTPLIPTQAGNRTGSPLARERAEAKPAALSRRSTAVFRPLAWQPIRRWWDGVIVAAVAAAIAFGGGNLGAAAQERPPPPIVCGGEILARGIAGRVADGRTFLLDDGREVRLAGIEVPPLAADSGSAPGGAASKDGLAALLAGSEIVLRQAEPQQTDRYGRIMAYAFVTRGGSERLVQAELLAAGLARVAPRVGSRACAMELLSRESAARRAKLGLWATSYYDFARRRQPRRGAGQTRPISRWSRVRWFRYAKAEPPST